LSAPALLVRDKPNMSGVVEVARLESKPAVAAAEIQNPQPAQQDADQKVLSRLYSATNAAAIQALSPLVTFTLPA